MRLVSVIIPVFDEEDNILPLFEELNPVLKGLSVPYEIIFVDDGSSDQSAARLDDLERQHPDCVRALHFEKNCGQTSAMDAGFRKAQGDIFVTLDSDLQNDPADIPKMMAFLGSYDVICGIRTKRRDTFVKRISSRIANSVRNTLSGDNIIDTGCTLKVYKKAFVDSLKLYDGHHRFLPTLLAFEGARIYQMPVNHRPRAKGQGKYAFTKLLVKPFLDLLVICWMKKYRLKYQIQSMRSETGSKLKPQRHEDTKKTIK